MKRSVYLASALILITAILTGIILTVQGTSPPLPGQYAVGGETIPLNPAPYLLNPILVGVVVVLALIIASLTIEGFPIKIEIVRQ